MSKVHKRAFFCGRLQHPHLGHVAEIEAAWKVADQVLVLVGSAQEAHTVRNPFPYDLRARVVKAIFPDPAVLVVPLPDLTNEDDVTHEWGQYVLRHTVDAFGGLRPDVMVYGNDENRRGWFAPQDIIGIQEIVLAHNLVPIHATQLREMMARGDIDGWSAYVHPTTLAFWHELRTELLKVAHYQRIADECAESS